MSTEWSWWRGPSGVLWSWGNPGTRGQPRGLLPGLRAAELSTLTTEPLHKAWCWSRLILPHTSVSKAVSSLNITGYLLCAHGSSGTTVLLFVSSWLKWTSSPVFGRPGPHCIPSSAFPTPSRAKGTVRESHIIMLSWPPTSSHVLFSIKVITGKQ